MRYEDTSGSFSSAAAGSPDARDDTDTMAAGSRSPATGNAISGEGTITGSAGADIIGNAPGQIVALQGANGSDTADSGGSLTAAGRYGTLTMNQDGGYSYRPNGAAPENARDTFNYTLADASGGRDTALLTIDIGHTPQVAANAQQVVPGPDGVVTLPPGVELSDVHVVGRNLVIDMPDGTQMVIIDGAVFVPQLVLGGVEVPSSNLAALLVDSEPKPAAGTPQSGGGNFAVDVGPLDPGVPLGDLIPPTELNFPQPEPEEVLTFADDEPELIIIPDGQPGAVNAVDSVDESGLPERPGEPEGTLEPQNIETTTGVISIDAEDGIDSVTINGVEIDSIGDEIVTERGVLTITSIDLNSGEIGYSYTATDNTTDGVDDFDDFTIVITDNDGDTATGTLHIDILDDEPIARNDTDAVTFENTTATGNVMTAVGTTNSPAGVDTVGADDATLTAVQGAGAADTTFDISGNLVVQGDYGTLTIDAEGNYTYELTSEFPEASDTDVFTYTLTDGDGDTVTATLTITIPGDPNDIPEILSADPTLVDEDGLEGANEDDGRPGEVDSTEDTSDTGSIIVDFKGDVPADLMGAITLIDDPALDGQLQTTDGQDIIFSLEGGDLVGRSEIDGDPFVIISITGAVAGPGGQVTYTYSVQLLGPVEHPVEGVEDSVVLNNVGVQVTDSNGDTDSATVDVTIVDDLPIAVTPPDNPQTPGPDPVVGGAVDEDDLPEGNSDVADGDDLADPSSTSVGGPAGSLAALFNAGSDSPIQNFGLVDDTSGLPELTSNGHDVVYDIDVAAGTLTATADIDGDGTIESDETVFTLTVNEDGSWSFELQGQLDHPEAGTEDNLLLDFSSIVSAEDADGDPIVAADGAFVIDVDDDSPTAVIPPRDPENPNDPPPPLISGAVDEDDLEDGNNDTADGDDLAVDSSTTVGGPAGSLAVLFNAGADQPLTYGLTIDPSNLPELTSNQHEVLYDIDAETGVLTAYADLDDDGIINDGDDAKVFTLTVGEDGSWSFVLQGQLDHSIPGTEDNLLLDLSGAITATDADGDPVTAADGSFVIDVDDDMPKPWKDPNNPENDGCPDDVIITNADGSIFHGNLNLPPVGADDPGQAFFDIADGTQAFDNNDKPITAEGQPIYYFVNDEGVLEARVGNDPEGDLVFTITLNEDGTYDYEQFLDITSTTTLHLTQFDAVGGGNVDAKAVDIPDSQFDLMVSTQGGDSVNTNNDTFGVSDGQSFEDGEIIRYDLVQDAFTTGSGGGAVVNYGDYYSATGFRQEVSGLAGGQLANFTVTAIVAVPSGAEPGADGDGVFFGDANDTVAAVTQLNIYNDSEQLVDPSDYAGLGITVTDLGGGVWQVEGLPNLYDFEITSDTPFNAVQVEATDDTGTFKLGEIDITTQTQTAVSFEVPVTFTDADGDPVVCDIDVILGPPTNTPDVIAQVNEAALDGIGSDGGSDAETTGGDLSSIVSGGSGTTTFALQGDADGVLVGNHGTITLTEDGIWTYTLTSPVDSTPDNDDGTNVEPGVETFTYEMIQGGEVVGTGTITVNVVDDVPTAEDDTDVIDEGDASELGNVMTGDGTTNDPAGDDTEGADGATVTAASGFGGAGTVGVGGNITVAGQWGTLVIEPDGDYTYTLSTEGAAALEELGEGQSLDAEVFTYTLTDGDGDEDTATLTITPDGANDVPGVLVPDTGADEKNVFEAGLAAGPDRPGEPAGTAEAADGTSTDNDVNSETVTGSFTFTAGDGATTITIQGSGAPIAVPLAGPFTPIVGDYGTLTITSIVGNTVNYSYTLADNIDHSDATPDQDDFTIVVDDSDGSTLDAASDILTIHINDDTPIAENDTDAIDEGDLSEQGNVISGDGTTTTPADSGDDRVGADDATVTGVTHPTGGVGTVGVGGNITVAGQWGTLVIEPDGDYTYTLSADGTTALNALGAGQTLAAEVFTYTLTDGDDSFDTATLTITPRGANDVPGVLVPDTGADEKNVFEAGLAAGPDRPGEPAGTAEAADGTSTDNDVNSETVTGSFTFTAGDGATTITIQGSGAPIAVPLAGPFTPIVGDYGTLTITSIVGNTVNYSYTLADNIDHSDATPDQDDFTIVVDDSDGSNADAASDILTIHINDDTPIAENDTDAIDEGDLSEQGNVISGDGTTTTPADSGDDRVGADDATVTGVTHPTGGVGTVGVGGNITVAGQWGTLVIEPDGDYTYTLSADGTTALNALGAGQTLAAEVFTYTLTDGDDSFDTATLTITPRGADDVPTLTVPDTGADEKRVDEAGLPTRTGDLAGTGEAADANPSNDNSEIVSGTFTFTPGDGATTLTIDGAGAGGPLTIPLAGPFPTVAIVGTYGNLVVTDVSGGTVSYTYTLTDNVDHDSQTPRDDFTITVDDSDGDTADKQTDTLSIHIDDDAPLDYQPDEAIVENSGTDSDTGFLDDDDTLANDGGADSIASLVWNVTDGTNLMTSDTIPVPVTVGGVQVKLYVDDVTGNLIATTDINSAAATVFTATLNAATSSYTIDFDRPLDNGSTTASDFSSLAAGNTPWKGLDTSPGNPSIGTAEVGAANDSTDLLFTGYSGTTSPGSTLITINTDNNDIGTGGGQKVNPNEYLRIDFVQDLRRDAGDDEKDDGGYTYDTHVGQTHFQFGIVESQSHGEVDVLVKAFNVDDASATAQSNVDATAINTQVAIDPASIEVTLNGVAVNPNTYEVILATDGKSVYVQGVPEHALISFTAVGEVPFEAVTIENANGDQIPGETLGTLFTGQPFGAGAFTFGQNDPGDPVEFELPTLLTDGDGDTSSGTIDVTVYPVGQEPAHLMSAQSLSKMAIIDDGAVNRSRTFDSANSNHVLLGAIAAAGLASTSAAANDRGFDDDGQSVSKLEMTLDDGGSKQNPIDSRESNHALTGETKEAIDDNADRSGGSKSHSEGNGEHSLTNGGESHDSQPPAELLAGTDTPQQEAPAQSILTSQTVSMPTAEMLTAAKGDGADEGQSKVTGEVGRVLEDALAGGDGGKNLDAVIDAIANRGHGGDKGGNEALASHGNGDVSHWDTAGLAAFQTHPQFTMESIQLHPDAAQPAA